MHAYRGAERSTARAKDRLLGFSNKRSATWWLFREALDPDQVGGSAVALPPDTTQLADLASVRFTPTTVAGKLVIKAEPKVDLVSRLGRSPDRGDAVVMAPSPKGRTMLDGGGLRRLGRRFIAGTRRGVGGESERE